MREIGAMGAKNGRTSQGKYGKHINQQNAVILFAIIVLAALSVDWQQLSPLIFSIALAACTIGIMGIISFLRNWSFAWRIFFILATLTGFVAAILTLRLSS